MLDTHVAWLANQGMNYLATGENPARLGNQHPNIAPYQVFPTRTATSSVGRQRSYVQAILRGPAPDASAGGRALCHQCRPRQQPPACDRHARPGDDAHPTSWWIERLEALNIGCGPINKLSQVFEDPHVVARGMVLEMEHSSGQTVKVIANPVKLSETPADYRIPPPLLGEHTELVLAERLGLDAAALAALRGKKVI